MRTGADLGQGPLGNVGMKGFAGVVLEKAHAKRRKALIRALVHISPVVQEKVDNVPVRMHLQSDKVRLVKTGAGPEQDMEMATWHPCSLIPLQDTQHSFGLGEGTSVNGEMNGFLPACFHLAFSVTLG